MLESSLTPAGGSRRVASRPSRGQMTHQLPCGHRVPKARSGKEWDAVRNAKRSLRNSQTITNRTEVIKESTRNRRRDRRKTRSATSKQEWRGLARHATTQLNQPTQLRAFQGTAKSSKHPNAHNRSKTTYIRKLTEDASIPNKLTEIFVPTKIQYKRKIKIASVNVRGMR